MGMFQLMKGTRVVLREANGTEKRHTLTKEWLVDKSYTIDPVRVYNSQRNGQHLNLSKKDYNLIEAGAMLINLHETSDMNNTKWTTMIVNYSDVAYV